MNKTLVERNLQILFQELRLSIRWRRPGMFFVVWHHLLEAALFESVLTEMAVRLGVDVIPVRLEKGSTARDLHQAIEQLRGEMPAFFLIYGLEEILADESAEQTALTDFLENWLEGGLRLVFFISADGLQQLAEALPEFLNSRHHLFLSGDGRWPVSFSFPSEPLPAQPVEHLREDIRAALELWRRGGADKALEMLDVIRERAAAAADDDVLYDTLMALGLIHMAVGNWQQALEAYDQAEEIRPGQTRLLGNRGKIYLNLGRFSDAERTFREILAAHPDDAAAWTGLGKALSQQKRWKGALDAFRKATELQPRLITGWIGLAKSLEALDRPEALQAWKEALKLDNRLALAWAGYGRLLWKHNQLDEAIDALLRALHLDETPTEWWLTLAEVQLACQDFDAACSALETLRNRPLSREQQQRLESIDAQLQAAMQTARGVRADILTDAVKNEDAPDLVLNFDFGHLDNAALELNKNTRPSLAEIFRQWLGVEKGN